MRAPLRTRLRNAWRELTGRASSRRGLSAYKAAEISRLTAEWAVANLHPDQELLRDSRRLRARARDLARNSSIIRQFRNLLAVNVVGPTGPKLQGQAQGPDGALDRATNGAIESAWKDWAESPVSVDGRLTLAAFQHLALKTVATEGECFVRKYLGFDNTHGFALQFIDPDQVDDTYNRPASRAGAEIRLGIEVDALGRPLAYWIRPYPVGVGMPVGQRTRIAASEIVHLYLPERANQTRGVSWLQTAMFKNQMLEGYQEAEVVAARTAAAKMGFFVAKEGVAGEMGEAGPDGAPPEMEANPGTFEALPPGYSFESWSPDHPSTAFPAFVKTVLRDIASGLGVSYNALANDLEGVNYSSIRAGLLTERDLWQLLQQWWIGSFLRPVYREWVNLALLKGALLLDGRRDARRIAQQVRWIPRGWSWVDPLKDIRAGGDAIASGLASRQQILSEQGEDFEETARQLQQEQQLAQELGITIAPPTTGGIGTGGSGDGSTTGDGGDGTGGSGGSQ